MHGLSSLNTLIICALFLLTPSTDAKSKVSQNIKYTLYPVKLTEMTTDLKKAISRASPLKINRKKFIGLTKWHINWNYKYRQKHNHCAVTQLSISVTAEIILPKLINATPQQSKRFERYATLLKKHELQHVAITRRHAHELDRFILNMPPAPTCAILEQRINGAGNQYTDKARHANNQYDLNTEHGKTEGLELDGI